MATINAVGVGLTGASGTGSFAGTTSPTFVTPTLGVATATSINFGGSTLANYVSNTSFTPTFTFGTPGDLNVAYSTQTGIYTRIGSMVFYSFNLICTPTFTTSSGLLTIGGLPITVGGSVNGNNVISFTAGVTYAAGRTSIFSLPIVGGNSLIVAVQGSAVGTALLDNTSVVSTVQLNITGTGFYFV